MAHLSGYPRRLLQGRRKPRSLGFAPAAIAVAAAAMPRLSLLWPWRPLRGELILKQNTRPNMAGMAGRTRVFIGAEAQKLKGPAPASGADRRHCAVPGRQEKKTQFRASFLLFLPEACTDSLWLGPRHSAGHRPQGGGPKACRDEGTLELTPQSSRRAPAELRLQEASVHAASHLER